MDVTAEIVHQLPGRIRLRLNEKRGDPEYFAALSENVSRCNGVQRVKVNPSTGSVIVEFSDSTESLVRRLEEEQGLAVARHEPAPRQNEPVTRPAAFHIVSNRDINPMFMVGTLLAAVGIVQTLRGKILVPSLSVLWYAVEAFRQSRTSTSGTAAGSREGEFTRH